MLENFPDTIKEFIACAIRNNLEMLLVGGGAVNFHGYQRHSADIDFWVNSTSENIQRLLNTLQALGYNIEDLPQLVSVRVRPLVNYSPIMR